MGFKYKEYQFIFEMDADFSHNPDDLIKLYNASKNETADLVIGSRHVKGVNIAITYEPITYVVFCIKI